MNISDTDIYIYIYKCICIYICIHTIQTLSYIGCFFCKFKQIWFWGVRCAPNKPAPPLGQSVSSIFVHQLCQLYMIHGIEASVLTVSGMHLHQNWHQKDWNLTYNNQYPIHFSLKSKLTRLKQAMRSISLVSNPPVFPPNIDSGRIQVFRLTWLH